MPLDELHAESAAMDMDRGAAIGAAMSAETDMGATMVPLAIRPGLAEAPSPLSGLQGLPILTVVGWAGGMSCEERGGVGIVVATVILGTMTEDGGGVPAVGEKLGVTSTG